MTRSVLDKLLSGLGAVMVVVLAVAAGLLFWASSYVHGQVHDQLAAQQIVFPKKGSSSLAALPASDRRAMAKYAGEQLTTGRQAEVWADHYIKVHLSHVANGETYAQVSAQAQQQPNDQQLQGKVQTLFRGETLRGLLLNAYAFGTMADIAWLAAWASVGGAVVLAVLVALGFWHAGRLRPSTDTRR